MANWNLKKLWTTERAFVVAIGTLVTGVLLLLLLNCWGQSKPRPLDQGVVYDSSK